MSGCDDYRGMAPLFLDRELSPADAGEFRRHAGECADCGDALAEEEALSELLHRTGTLYRAPSDLRRRVTGILTSAEPRGAPERLRRRVLRVLAPRKGLGPMQLIPPGLAALVLLSGPAVVRHMRSNDFVETAAATHRGFVDGSLPMEISTSSAAEVTRWFSGKVPFRLELPEQPPGGDRSCRIVGSRLVNLRDTFAAMTTYQMQREKISILAAPEESVTAEGGEEVHAGRLVFHHHAAGGLKVITWSDNGVTYALVSSLPGSARQSCLVCHQNMPDRGELSVHR